VPQTTTINVDLLQPSSHPLQSSSDNVQFTGTNVRQASEKQGTLTITVQPLNARLFIDGKIVEKRPAIVKLSPGEHHIQAQCEGFVSTSVTETVKESTEQVLSLRLRRMETTASLRKLAQAFTKVKNFTKAIDCLSKAVDLEPHNVNLHIELIDVVMRSGDDDLALNIAQRSNVLFPDSLSISYLYGLTLFKKGSLKKALFHLKKATNTVPVLQLRLESLAVCYETLKQWQDVVNTADRMITAGFNSSETYNLKGFALFKLKKYDKSCSAFTRALQLTPESYQVLLNASGANLAAGNKVEGQKLLKRALAVSREPEKIKEMLSSQ